MISIIENNLDENKNIVDTLSNCLSDLQNNKREEEKKINDFCENLQKIILDKKNDLLEKVNKIFAENGKKIELELNSLKNNISKAESIKNILESALNSKNNFRGALGNYQKFINEIKDQKSIKLDFNEMIFFIENPEKLYNLLLNYGELKINTKRSKNHLKKDSNENSNNNEIRMNEILANMIIYKQINTLDIKNYDNQSNNQLNKDINKTSTYKNYNEIIKQNLNSKESCLSQSISVNNNSSTNIKPEIKERKMYEEITNDYYKNPINNERINLNDLNSNFNLNNLMNKTENTATVESSNCDPYSLKDRHKQDLNYYLPNNQLDLNLIKYGTNFYNFSHDKYKTKLGIVNQSNPITNPYANNVKNSIKDFNNNLNNYSNPVIDMKYEKIMNSHKNIETKNLVPNYDNKNLYCSPSSINDKCKKFII